MSRLRSFASLGCATGLHGMSAMPPIALESMHSGKLARSTPSVAQGAQRGWLQNRFAARCGRIVRAGAARADDDSKFRIDLAGPLPAGSYALSALIAVGGNVMNADIRRIPVVIAGN
jgi:hypothetical protein